MSNPRPFTVESVRTVRCASQPGRYSSDKTHWSITAFPFPPIEQDEYDGNSPELALVSELYAHNELASVAVTTEALIRYHDGADCALQKQNNSDANVELTRVVSQINQLLYESASTTARVLLAMTQLDVVLPPNAPSPEVSIFDGSETDGTNG